MQLRPAGREALLVECAGIDEVIGLHAALRDDRPVGCVDLVPAARTLLVTFDATATTGDAVVRHVRRLVVEPGRHTEGPVVEIPVTYDGEDLAEVARLTGLTEDEVVRRHAEGRYVVAFCGFSPGFGYLVGADPALDVPRRATPRTRVPAGAVALAGPFTGVYPRPGPGGWQLIGSTDAVLWDLAADPPALLSPGASVRFVPVTS